MKRVLLKTLVLSLSFITLAGCVYDGYTGDNPDLYTVAINSVPWTFGHSFSADRRKNSEIEVIDKDAYGRVMFTYYEAYYLGLETSFSSLIICQWLNENEVFFYENVNYIIKKQPHKYINTENFETEEIEQLKIANDWGQTINFDKCIKKEIIKSKPGIPHEKEVEKEIALEFDLRNGNYRLFIDFLTNSSDNTMFIAYGFIRIYESEGAGINFILLAENIGEVLGATDFFIPLDKFNYKTEFIAFKIQNGWN